MANLRAEVEVEVVVLQRSPLEIDSVALLAALLGAL